MAKKTKKKVRKLTITRRTLNRLMKLIPAKRRKNIELGVKNKAGVRRIGGWHKSRRRKTQRKRR